MSGLSAPSVIRSYDEVRERLAFDADDEYREFAMKICPSERPFLGIRVPRIRKIAESVQKEKIEELIKVEPIGYEEVLVRGFLIARLRYEEMMKWFDSQALYIDDWSTCDTFCSAIGKKVRKNKSDFFENKMEWLLGDSREFVVRLGLVILKCCYVDFDYLAVIFDRVEKLSGREEYYIKMGIAWLVCECFIKFPDETLAYLSISRLPKWTYNKTISKICDSYRVEPEVKEALKKMRK